MQLTLIGKSRAKYARREVPHTIRFNRSNVGIGDGVIDAICKRQKMFFDDTASINMYFAVAPNGETYICLTKKIIQGAEPFIIQARRRNEHQRCAHVSEVIRRSAGVKLPNGKYVIAESDYVDGHLWTRIVSQHDIHTTASPQLDEES